MSVYGVGMVCMSSLELQGRLTRGLQSIIQDLYHALMTVPGTMATDPSFGLGLLEYTLAAMDEEDIPAIGSLIETEFAKDDRVKSTDASVTVGVGDGPLQIDIIVALHAGPSFRFIGPIDSVRTEILSNGG